VYDPQLSDLIAAAIARLQADMAEAAPFMAEQVCAWLKHLSGPAEPKDYFQHPQAFPSLLLPWWLEKSIQTEPDLAFQADLVYSTINGYYAIRLMDNLMDGHATVELKLLPALSFFQTQFQRPYQRYFSGDHPFWDVFSSVWFHSSEVTIRDASLSDLDETTFKQVSAQKICAAKIPLVAACYCHNRPDLIEPWARLVDLLGCWHQFLNDLFGWHRDYARQTCTYFLSEAERRRAEDEPVAGWIAREGFAWAIDQAEGWMSALRTLSAELGSPDLTAYLETRETMLRQQQEEVTIGLRNLARLMATGHR
jgi:hypothetical protein